MYWFDWLNREYEGIKGVRIERVGERNGRNGGEDCGVEWISCWSEVIGEG